MGTGRRPEHWPKSWDSVTAPGSEVEAATLVKDCRLRSQFMLQRIARIATQSRRRAVRLSRRWLHSDSAKIAMMEAAFAKKGYANAPRLEVIKMATAISADHFSGEAVTKKLVERADGKWRLTYNFGPMEYARQRLVQQVAKIFAPISASQFMHSGGTPAAAEWLNSNVRSKTWITTTDIPDCFLRQSRVPFESGGFLPRSVMTSVMFVPMAKAKRQHPVLNGGELVSSLQEVFYCDVEPTPERGLPPGSAPSSLLVDMRLGELARSAELATEGVKVGNYLDNFIILAPTKAAADVTFEALCHGILDEYGADAAEQVRHRRTTMRGHTGFVFLGDTYVREGRKLKRRMLPSRRDAYATRLANRIQHEHLSVKQIEESLRSWVKHHSYDPEAHAFAEELRNDFLPKEDAKAEVKTLPAPTTYHLPHYRTLVGRILTRLRLQRADADYTQKERPPLGSLAQPKGLKP